MLRGQIGGMGGTSATASDGQKLSTRKRMLLASAMITGCVLAGCFVKRIFGLAPALLSLTPSLVFILVFVLRPEWSAKLQRKEQEKLEQWQPHPGRWLP